ncbi:tail fiber assembly protein [Salmonella enterica subsp. enterica serovar Give]|nr:tail fiber assembly protein [Salmonella enterica subsp. enterica serovar Give]ELC5001943.1 tail fiber assembly protein [Salmonella enterica]
MFFSPSQNRFYQPEWKYDYVAAGDWPEDLTEVTDAVFSEFTSYKAGYVRGVVDGMPAWIDAPALTKKQLTNSAEQKKSALLAVAKSTISLWQTELMLGAISDGDKSSLTEWMAYIKALQAVDISEPESITWPDAPTTG